VTATLVIFRQNLRLLLGDPGPIVIFVLTPLLVMAILKPTQELVLAQQGFPHANGAEQVVPGFIVMFVFFWISFEIIRPSLDSVYLALTERRYTSDRPPAGTVTGRPVRAAP
jgi:ABC-2 type transport system permease protein